MILSALADLGPWSWILLGMILLGLEIAVPGVYLLWSGIAALIIGAVSFPLWDTALWTWHVQVVLFLVLSLLAAFIGTRYVGIYDTQSDEPLLNRPGIQLIGRTAILRDPITEGRGRIQLGDTMWLVQGPDLPAGGRVRVTGVSGSELIVEPA
ncbi:NfeD family protein [Tianweitania sp. BSSL-BM11]|uniref:NfeD family protein n=1 Tax=Tianweitania aestuarii TaxID=2814886 RepID=A0ABS5RVD6_9HYPH|nr:NfeD family protein [Tianweitania aestuarii]MBS9721020.1 NfeD family protein [Tianweitania aestuarii]